MGKSPLIRTKMSFGQAFKELTAGKLIRRAEWPEDGTHLVLSEEKVMIYRPDDKKLHPLIVSSGDILGDDWMCLAL